MLEIDLLLLRELNLLNLLLLRLELNLMLLKLLLGPHQEKIRVAPILTIFTLSLIKLVQVTRFTDKRS
jgi:hypothetical protein